MIEAIKFLGMMHLKFYVLIECQFIGRDFISLAPF